MELEESPLKYLGIKKKEENEPETRKSKRVAMKQTQESFSCEKCPLFKKFPNEEALSRHITQNHPKCLTCDFCGFETNLKNNLKQHMKKKHMTWEICKLCDKALVGTNLLCHNQKFHQKDDLEHYICQICDKQFKTQTKLTSHVKEHSPDDRLVCKYCNRTFSNPRARLEHVKYVHEYEGDEVSCPICSKGFKRLRYLKRHLEYHEKIKDPRPPEKYPFPCDECEMRFMQEKHFLKHKSLHEKKRSLKLTCRYCLKVCRSAQHLETHQYRHDGVYPFSCEICAKGFPLKRDLYTHMKMHKNEQPSKDESIEVSLIEIVSDEVEELFKGKPRDEELQELERILCEEPPRVVEQEFNFIPKKRPPTVRIVTDPK